MRKLLTLLFVGFFASLQAQQKQLHFRSTTWTVEQQANLSLPSNSMDLADSHYYGLVVFAKIPDGARQREYGAQGVELSGYLPNNAFYARISEKGMNYLQMQDDIWALIPVPAAVKSSYRIQNASWHEDCLLPDGRIRAHTLYGGADITTASAASGDRTALQ